MPRTNYQLDSPGSRLYLLRLAEKLAKENGERISARAA